MPDEKYREIFSNRLNHYMNEYGKRQQDLIDDLGLSSATVSSWVNGQRLPRMGKIQMLADYFNIDTTDLLEENTDSEEYYLNPETRRLAQELYDNPERRILFDATRNLTPESIKAVLAIIDNLEKK